MLLSSAWGTGLWRRHRRAPRPRRPSPRQARGGGTPARRRRYALRHRLPDARGGGRGRNGSVTSRRDLRARRNGSGHTVGMSCPPSPFRSPFVPEPRRCPWPLSASSTAISAPAPCTRSTAFASSANVAASRQLNVLGVLSLVFWALVVVVTVKYVAVVLRADNDGEGGIMALIALALRGAPAASRGDGRRRCSAWSAPRSSTATASSRRPSRCSRAIEGTGGRDAALQPCVVPLTLAILVGAVRGAAARHRPASASCSAR